MCGIHIVPTLKSLWFNWDNKTDPQNMSFQKCIASSHPFISMPTSWLKPAFKECCAGCLAQCCSTLTESPRLLNYDANHTLISKAQRIQR